MKLLSSETAASEVIGHAIILSITIIGISMIALYGVPAIYSLEDMANVRSVEQAFTVLDSRASRAILGESPLQITNINLGGGTMTVEPNSTNTTSFMVINSSSFNITIPMGKVKYTLGDRTVAYEGGGVWSKYPTGGSVMLSPPEFHYNGVTLTLPAMNVSGNTSVGGKGTATVSIKKKTTVVQYPNTSCADCANRTNPVNSSDAGTGKVYVNITSDYYDAWENYAESLGYTIVSTNPTTHTTSIELTVVPATLGSSTSITNPIPFRGLNTSDDTPLENFSFVIKNADSNFNWQLTATRGTTKTLIFYLKKSGGPGDYLDLSIGYQDTGLGYPTSDSAELWIKEKAFPILPTNYAEVNLLNKSINLSYNNVNVGADSGTCTKIKNSDFNGTDFSWVDRNIIVENTLDLYNITQHYIWKISQPEGETSLSKCEPGCSNHGPGADSTMLLNYNATGALTYLHITENRADVSIG